MRKKEITDYIIINADIPKGYTITHDMIYSILISNKAKELKYIQQNILNNAPDLIPLVINQQTILRNHVETILKRIDNNNINSLDLDNLRVLIRTQYEIFNPLLQGE